MGALGEGEMDGLSMAATAPFFLEHPILPSRAPAAPAEDDEEGENANGIGGRGTRVDMEPLRGEDMKKYFWEKLNGNG